ncbi:hypothetical protein KZZ52_54835 [Dactylosporangium sp. AC04546]|uniref:hypothetical protein n=1 Tax=Dactylosporangium sp. AC04546 TaxID=2862460 RepID=UPI001EDFE64A|nr:hypothetical protein [Dactylosporangium sp. AC04546]WVK82916.1 hypothetical protein KZZ52_54835 [Dactylosporangium sp. AC04546]
MRHIRTLIAAIVIAPLAWVLLALGQVRSTDAFADDTLHAGDFVRPVAFLAAAGLVLGLLGTLRFSPLGATVIGVLYTLSYTMLLVAPAKTMSLFNDDLWVAGKHIDLTAPIRSGTTMVLGVLLLIAAASMQRWRRWPYPQAEAPEPTDTTNRPLGVEGLGLASAYRDTEPESTVRYPTTSEPYDTNRWPTEQGESTTQRQPTSASQAPYGW